MLLTATGERAQEVTQRKSAIYDRKRYSNQCKEIITMTGIATKPVQSEYAPYYEKYVSLVTEDNVVEAMKNSLDETLKLLRGVDEEKANYCYAEGKWSIKEVIGHINDGERVFAYRALRFARNDKTALPGFDQDPYIENGNFNDAKLSELLDEFEIIRRSTIALFSRLTDEAWQRTGVANDAEISVRALASIILGHERHHIGIIRSRYLQ